jgi:hypothetical protein
LEIYKFGGTNMSTSKNKKLYNYLVNTFGLSKEIVLSYVNERIEEILNKHVDSLLRSDRVEKIILNRISHYISEGETSIYSKTSFEKIIKNQIKEVVKDELRKNASITFSFSNTVDFLREDK